MKISSATTDSNHVAHPSERLHVMAQAGAYSSPWPMRTRMGFLLWSVVWVTLFRPTPKPLVRWRLWLLRVFGAHITGRPYVASSARIKMPWNLTLEDRACLADRSDVYNLGPIILRQRCTVAQESYLCAGTHDFTTPDYPLIVGPIEIQADAFIGARAFILPGVIVGTGAVIGACAVVSRDMPPWTICAGNPCKPMKPRKFVTAPDGSHPIPQQLPPFQ